MFSGIWGNKPYRATDMPLETDTVSQDQVTEGFAEPKTVHDVGEGDASDTKEAVGDTSASWWDYTTSYTNKLRESAQNIDYTKLSEKIGQTVNKDTVTTATKGLGSYLNTVYNGVKSSVETIQKDGIPYNSASLNEFGDELLTDLGIPMLSEFDDEQKKFTKMQQRRQGAAVPPWVGYNEEEKMQKQILSLSLDERNVLRDPPAGVDFVFDFDANMPVATAMLQIDAKLNDLRFKLVPKMIKEDKFWRNYFYRVSLIKQSAQLSTIEKAATSAEGGAVSSSLADVPQSDEPDYSFSPQEEEFISDHLSNYEDAEDEALELNEEELQQIGLRKDTPGGGAGGGAAGSKVADEEWERELARELQDFDMVEDADSKLDTDNFEAELEEMLQDQ